MDEYRKDKTRWKELELRPTQNEERGDFDSNEKNRLKAVLHLQYDRRAEDEYLIRFIFEQEVLARRNDSFQGIGTTLELGAFLLARFKSPEDIPLFIKAKMANFDTHCGFSVNYAFVALREGTQKYVKENHPDLCKEFADNPSFLELPDNLNEWWKTQEETYPESENEEDLTALYKRYFQLGEMERARYFLDRWADQEPESDNKWSYLKFEYERLGDYDQSILFAQKILESAKTSWDKASALQTLIELHHKAGNFDFVLGLVRELDKAFSNFDEWKGVGLGHMAIHGVYEVSADHPNLKEAREILKIADRWFKKSKNIALVGLEAGVRAARRCDLPRREKKLQKLADAENRRIKAML